MRVSPGVGIDRLGASSSRTAAGGSNADNTTAGAAADAKGHRPWKFVQDNVKAGNFKMSNDLASVAARPSGKQLAAMTIGRQLDQGAMKNDYRRSATKVVRDARGSTEGHLDVHPVLGLATDSKNKDAAIDLISSF